MKCLILAGPSFCVLSRLLQVVPATIQHGSADVQEPRVDAVNSIRAWHEIVRWHLCYILLTRAAMGANTQTLNAASRGEGRQRIRSHLAPPAALCWSQAVDLLLPITPSILSKAKSQHFRMWMTPLFTGHFLCIRRSEQSCPNRCLQPSLLKRLDSSRNPKEWWKAGWKLSSLSSFSVRRRCFGWRHREAMVPVFWALEWCTTGHITPQRN